VGGARPHVWVGRKRGVRKGLIDEKNKSASPVAFLEAGGKAGAQADFPENWEVP